MSSNASGKTSLASVVAAMGIVFGDIATSPLYTLQECLAGPHGVAPIPENVLGCVSLIVWSLLLVVTLKYVTVLMPGADPGKLTYVLGQERIAAGTQGRMGALSEKLYAALHRNAANPSDYFELPSEQVVEVGARIDL